MLWCSSRGILCVFLVLGSEKSGWERDWSDTRGCVVQVTFFFLGGLGGVCQCRIGMGGRGCRWELVCVTRHAPHQRPTRTTRTHATHLDTLCLCRLASIPLSLVSCQSRLLSLVCRAWPFERPIREKRFTDHASQRFPDPPAFRNRFISLHRQNTRITLAQTSFSTQSRSPQAV